MDKNSDNVIACSSYSTHPSTKPPQVHNASACLCVCVFICKFVSVCLLVCFVCQLLSPGDKYCGVVVGNTVVRDGVPVAVAVQDGFLPLTEAVQGLPCVVVDL